MGSALSFLGGGKPKAPPPPTPADFRIDETAGLLRPLVGEDLGNTERINQRTTISPFGSLAFDESGARILTPSARSNQLMSDPFNGLDLLGTAATTLALGYPQLAPEAGNIPVFGGIGQNIQPGQFDLSNVPGVNMMSPGKQLGFNTTAGALGQMPNERFGGDQNLSDAAIRAEKATFDRMRGLLQPQFDRDTRRAETQLTNIGLPRGSAARSESLGELRTNQNEALTRAALDAVRAGQARQSEEFGQRLAGSQTRFGQQLGGLQAQAGLGGQLFGQGLQDLSQQLGANQQFFNQRLGTRGQGLQEALAQIESGQRAQQTGFEQGLLKTGFDNSRRGQLLGDIGQIADIFGQRRALDLASAQGVAGLLPQPLDFVNQSQLAPLAAQLSGQQFEAQSLANALAAQAANQGRRQTGSGIGRLLGAGLTAAVGPGGFLFG